MATAVVFLEGWIDAVALRRGFFLFFLFFSFFSFSIFLYFLFLAAGREEEEEEKEKAKEKRAREKAEDERTGGRGTPERGDASRSARQSVEWKRSDFPRPLRVRFGGYYHT